MRLEIFIGLTDRHGKPYNWNIIYPELAEKISEITYATLFPGLKGIYKMSGIS